MKKHRDKEKALFSLDFNLFRICSSFSIAKIFKVHTLFECNTYEALDSHDFSTLGYTGAMIGLIIEVIPSEIVVAQSPNTNFVTKKDIY